MSNKDALILMFDRPMEPLIVPKGDSTRLNFIMPDNYLNKRYRGLKKRIKKRFEAQGAQQLVVKNTSLPDITIPLQLPRSDSFSLFLPKHRVIAGKLVDIFMEQRTLDDLVSTAAYCRDRLNPYLFNYCLSVALLHRRDTKNVSIPNFFESFPGKFFDSTVFSSARREATIIPEDSRQPIIIPRNFTATDAEPEQIVAYFREDLGINLHHWHWHLVYPFIATERSIVDKDRRGELFYYMHEQILARYNIERFCNGLSHVKSLDLKEKVTEAYFPKLQQLVASRAWPPRFKSTEISDINRPNDQFVQRVEDLITWISNITEAIETGFAIDFDGNNVDISGENGIDILGNMAESSILSPNRQLYGDLHNMGHILISLCHDPDGRYLESFSVMGDTATAMRDPVFYRWHNTINELFVLHKNKLPYYPKAQLDFQNITITDFSVHVEGKDLNELYTFWEQSDVNMSRGLDFSPRGPLLVRITHLQHMPYVIKVKVKNSSSVQLMGTIRLFLAPRLDAEGKRLKFEDQRKLMIEMDKFSVTIKPGENDFTRNGEDSSVSLPYEVTFQNQDHPDSDDPEEMRKYNYCGCGWPDHMMVPKGTPGGYPIDLFAMVSNYELDKIDQDPSDVCAGAESYCGVFDQKYPDKRSMGYPFDRVAKPGIEYINEFLTSNMIIKEGVIIHKDETNLRENPDPTIRVLPVQVKGQ